jgi:hypothetical protein
LPICQHDAISSNWNVKRLFAHAFARCSLQDPVVVTLKTSGNCPCPRATEGIRYFLAPPRLRSLLALNLAADIRAITAR